MKERNYDAEPIIIHDISPLYAWWEMIYFAIPLYIVIMLFFIDDPYKYVHTAIMVPIFLWPAYKQYQNAKDKRELHLTNHKILYKHENKLISEIRFDSKVRLSLSFQNYYHSSQSNAMMLFILIFVIVFVIFAVQKSVLVALIILLGLWLIDPLLFQLTKLIKFMKSYRFYQSVIVENENTLINIPMMTSTDYLEVKNYFARFGHDVDNLPKTIKLFTGYEKIEFND